VIANYHEFTEECRRARPLLFLVLGSGQGLIGERISSPVSLRFSDTAGMPPATVAGHKGQFTVGTLGGATVLVSEGRVHGYEGHSTEAITRPVRLAADVGVRFAVFTNAAGGIREGLGQGALMPLNSQMDWREKAFPIRASERSPYCAELLGLVVREAGFPVWPGTYAATSGPSYETPAEVRALRRAGADAVGMSTCPEVKVAAGLGLRCAGISLITNRAAGLADAPIDHQEVLAVARKSGQALANWLERVAIALAKLHTSP
jgi:purine-nucleoside phosphorylase